VVVAAVGAYIQVAPTDASLTVTTKTWRPGDLVDSWAPWRLAAGCWRLVVGGALAAVGMAASVIRSWHYLDNRWLVAGEGMLVIGGVVAMVWGIGLLT
jgi:hypothetical protein